MVAAHAARLAGERPRRQPAALFLSGQQGVHITALLSGMQDIGERELAAEGVPKAVVGKHITVVNLSVVGTIIIRCAVLLDFVELT